MSKYKLFFLPILLFILINMLGTYFYNKSVQNLQDDFKQIFRQEAEKEFNSYRESIKSDIAVLQATASLFHASQFVDREEFYLFVSEVIKNHPNIEAMNWIIPINHNERQEYEQNMQNKGFTGFTIHTGISNNKLISSPEKKRYFPRQYSVVSQGGGLDSRF
jgi:CHASE1-domain containing sensor protein